jgi:pyruvate,water dikinase
MRGKVRVFEEFSLPDRVDFDIMVARNTDPGWAALIGLSKGIIVENGGILSHAAIVSRELGIPTVIGVANVTQILKSGQVVEINGRTGEVRVVD